MPTEWHRVTLNLTPGLSQFAKQRAKARRMSLSAYVASLIDKDERGEVPHLSAEQRREVLSLVEEAAARYEAAARKPARKGGTEKES